MRRRTSSGTLSPEILRDLLPNLTSRVVGQREVHERMVQAIQRIELGAVPPGGSERCFLIVGPTGVGKTETVETTATLMYGPGSLVRFDCAEFKTLERLNELLGSRAGDPGRFRQAYAAVSRGVWLFDEIEKAHPEFVHLFLAMTEANRVTLADGETLDLRHIYLMVTSNLGSAEILGREHLPFTSLEARVIRCVERHFRPELLRRFGKPYVFRPLMGRSQHELVEVHLRILAKWHEQQGRRIDYGPEVVRFLAVKGFSDRLGAGPLLATIRQFVGDAIVENLMTEGSGSGHLVVVGSKLRLVP